MCKILIGWSKMYESLWPENYTPCITPQLLLFLWYSIWQVLSCYNDSIVLRTPTLSTGEKMLNAYFKNQTNNNVSIFEFEYPNCMKEVQDIMRDKCWNAERKNLAIKTVRNLNGLLQCYSSITDINQEETIQVCYARIVLLRCT